MDILTTEAAFSFLQSNTKADLEPTVSIKFMVQTSQDLQKIPFWKFLVPWAVTLIILHYFNHLPGTSDIQSLPS